MSWLDGSELERADRYRFERDRTRFLRRRVLLREILARYLGTRPDEVRLSSTARGKPELEGGGGLEFNTSQTDGLAVVAVTRGHSIGVDIERLRPIDDALELARAMFHASEVESLEAIPEQQRARAFLTLWTRKESVAKAIGEGLSLPLDGFEVLAEDEGSGRPHGPLGALPYVYADFGRARAIAGSVALKDVPARPAIALRSAA